VVLSTFTEPPGSVQQELEASSPPQGASSGRGMFLRLGFPHLIKSRRGLRPQRSLVIQDKEGHRSFGPHQKDRRTRIAEAHPVPTASDQTS